MFYNYHNESRRYSYRTVVGSYRTLVLLTHFIKETHLFIHQLSVLDSKEMSSVNTSLSVARTLYCTTIYIYMYYLKHCHQLDESPVANIAKPSAIFVTRPLPRAVYFHTNEVAMLQVFYCILDLRM